MPTFPAAQLPASAGHRQNGPTPQAGPLQSNSAPFPTQAPVMDSTSKFWIDNSPLNFSTPGDN